VAKTCTLIIETQLLSEWFISNLNLVQLVIKEDFNVFVCCEEFKSYTSTVFERFNFQVSVYDPSTLQWCPVQNMVISAHYLTALAVTNKDHYLLRFGNERCYSE
jgi:hypothetical protein